MSDVLLIWTTIIALGVFIYVALDGFDLGTGIFFAFIKGDSARGTLMASVAPVWDGNETWMVLGGAGLFAAFPVVYSAVLSALYIPLGLMLVGLVVRGISLEVRGKARRTRRLWEQGFFWGSLLATFCQGVAVGAYVQGIAVRGWEFAGGVLDCLSPFSFLCGFGLVLTYAVLGGGWLIMKTTADLQSRVYARMGPLVAVWALSVAAIVIATPTANPMLAARWETSGLQGWFLILMLGGLAGIAGTAVTSSLRKEVMPFLSALLTMACGYLALLTCVWPDAIPGAVTLVAAAAPDTSLKFSLVGVLLILPVIIAYTVFGYWTFRGKTLSGEGYH